MPGEFLDHGCSLYLVGVHWARVCLTDVAKEVFDRCAVTNEGERLTRDGERITREDENFLITLDYEFLEDFEYHLPGKLKRVHSWKRSVDKLQYIVLCIRSFETH